MSLPIEPAIKILLLAGKIPCPKCGRPMTELDYIDRAVDEDGEHARFRCRICYPPSLPN